ncbi:haloacid dehalogenase-like hydrolase domain-containing 5 isoform X2 [Hetaerina americana]|uniref:haloacid dehalogenase-like hydrolase domain-containing 5 isoform X2 n=1 Tax=Hetaerina americana TaxID=62018 RepID=UPI003A7F62CE
MPAMLIKVFSTTQFSRCISTTIRRQVNPFGLLFDIDGVLVRSSRVLPSVREAFARLVDPEGNFRVPTVFVTNAGNTLRRVKAAQLTNWLGVQVKEHQVVMAHTPLTLFKNFHHKHALLSGQGPLVDIAKNLGFTSVTTVERLSDTFPALDASDHGNYSQVHYDSNYSFKPVEVVVLFGEPVRWERSLQLLIDILVTNGDPRNPSNVIVHPHIPILACNMDFQWMAEACMPRLAHGAFLKCLESLYKKTCNRDLIYTAIIGKPSEITYHHAHMMIMRQAKEIGIKENIEILYAIGDNICTDIFGANLYNQYLARKPVNGDIYFPRVNCSVDEFLNGDDMHDLKHGARACTGVFSPNEDKFLVNHMSRDFLPVEEDMLKPDIQAKDVSDAIDIIFSRQNANE